MDVIDVTRNSLPALAGSRVLAEEDRRWSVVGHPANWAGATWMRNTCAIALFAGAYYLAYRYGMSFSQAAASPFWFPDSVLLCALLFTPPSRWWLFILVSFPIRLLTSVPGGVPLWFLFTAFAIDSAKGVITAVVLNRYVDKPDRLETIRAFALFCVIAVTLVPALGAICGAVARSAWGYAFWPAWKQWFLGDALAQLVITPAILYWGAELSRPQRLPAPRRLLEAFLLTVGLVVSGYMALDTSSGAAGLLELESYLSVPFLLWAGIRFGMLGASSAILSVTFFAVWGALEGRGPFAGHSPADTALYLQYFLLWKAAPLYLIAILIAHKNLVEHTLRESEARFRRMADSAPVLIWMSDRDGQPTYFNQQWLDFTGRAHQHEEGEDWLQGVHPDDLQHCMHVYQTAFRARMPFVVEYQMRRRDGKYHWVVNRGIPRLAADGTFLGYIGSCADISERKQAEAEAHRQRTELAHVGRVSMLGQLSSALAHELTQPLTAILRNAEAAQLTLERAPVDLAEIRAIIADIREDDSRAGRVIERMRALLQRRDLACEPLCVRELLEQAVSLTRAEMQTRRVAVTLNAATDLPAVAGDRVHLQQVLLNLLMNGADAMRDSPPEQRRVHIGARLVGSDSVEISVEDRGHGIPEGKLAQLFEPFFTTKASGIGLGLSISKTIIQAHGGQISAANNKNTAGATFAFRLKTVPG